MLFVLEHAVHIFCDTNLKKKNYYESMKILGIFSSFGKRNTQYSNNDTMKVQVIYTPSFMSTKVFKKVFSP